MTYSKISDFYGNSLKNAFEAMYCTQLGTYISQAIYLSPDTSNTLYLSGIATSAVTGLDANNRKISTIYADGYKGMTRSFTSVDSVTVEMYITVVGTHTTSGNFFIQDEGNKQHGIYFNVGMGIGVYLNNSGVATAQSFVYGTEYHIIYEYIRGVSLNVWIDGVLKYSGVPNDSPIKNVSYSFRGDWIFRQLNCSADVGYLDFDKYLYNIQYQMGAEGDTLFPYQISYRFTNEGISTAIVGSSMLSERILGLDMIWYTNYANMNNDLYKCAQIIRFLETEFASHNNVSSVTIEFVDQQIIDNTTSESSVQINSLYRITLLEQYISDIVATIE